MICKKVSPNPKSWLPSGDHAKTLTWSVAKLDLGVTMSCKVISNTVDMIRVQKYVLQPGMSGQVVLIKQSSLEENVSLQKQKHFVGLTKTYFERNIP